MSARQRVRGLDDGLRRFGTVLGFAVSVAALVWVVRGLVRQPEVLETALGDPALRLGMLVATPLYAALLLLPALAWRLLIGARGARIVTTTAVVVWLRANIGKYLPGNLFHLVGRQMLGRRHGLAHGAQAWAAVAELAILALAAGCLLPLRWLPLRWPPTGASGITLGVAVVLIALGIVAGIVALLRRGTVCLEHGIRGEQAQGRAAERRGELTHDSLLATRRRVIASGVQAWVADLAFLVGCGALLAMLLSRVSADAGSGTGIGSGTGAGDSAPLGLVIAAYALAWLIGTVTPGAPGGLGVREAVLVWQLGGVVSVPAATVAALSLRLVTTLGDVLAATLAWLAGPTDRP